MCQFGVRGLGENKVSQNILSVLKKPRESNLVSNNFSEEETVKMLNQSLSNEYHNLAKTRNDLTFSINSITIDIEKSKNNQLKIQRDLPIDQEISKFQRELEPIIFRDDTKLTDIKKAKELKDLQISITDRLVAEKAKIQNKPKFKIGSKSLIDSVEALKKVCLPYANIEILEGLRDNVNHSMARYDEFFKKYQPNPGMDSNYL